ncbi:hypothetical protein LCGC14_1171400 [marine sediment metagenome]|uniref:LamG-like jellyroll fold domain-containing protein n=1 Tax=marine sediment metagenome TaxID=412755 RepID=A0A0F9PV96_9ZZZZ
MRKHMLLYLFCIIIFSTLTYAQSITSFDYYKTPGTHLQGGTFIDIDRLINPASLSIAGRSYDYGNDKGLYSAYFRDMSSDVLDRPMAIVSGDNSLTFSPQDFVTFEPKKATKNGRVGNRVQATAESSTNSINYAGQYEEIGSAISFADLTYKYLDYGIKEELVIWDKDYVQTRFDDQVNQEDYNITNLIFSNIVRAYSSSDSDSNTLGVFYGSDRVLFKAYGLSANNEQNTQEEIYFTDSDGNTIYKIPVLVAYDSNGQTILLNKSVSQTSFGNLKISVLVPFKWLNATERSYPVYIDPSIEIINPHEYPRLNSNWTVIFNTSGTSDLWITGVDNTPWTDYSDEGDLYELKFLELRCGDTPQAYTWTGNSVFVEDYNCDGQTSYEVSKVISYGPHTLMFQFGSSTEYAYNTALIEEAWYKFEGNQKDNTTRYDLTVSSGSPTFITDSIVGTGAVSLDQNEGFVHTDFPIYYPNITIAGWFNVSSKNTNGNVLFKQPGTPEVFIIVATTGGGGYGLRFGYGSDTVEINLSGIGGENNFNNSWGHFAFVVEQGERIKAYKNGTLSDQGPIVSAPITLTTKTINIGETAGGSFAEFFADDLRFLHNVSLNQAEISFLYNSGAGTDLSISTTILSTILQNPKNNIGKVSPAAYNFSCNVTHDTAIQNISLFANFSGVYKTNETKKVFDGTPITQNATFTNKTLSVDGAYVWNCLGSIDGEAVSSPQNRTIYVDSTPPAFTNLSANLTNVLVGSALKMNATISDISADSYIFLWNITGTWVNDSPISVTSDLLETTKEIVTSGGLSFAWKYWVNDSSGLVSLSQAQSHDITALFYNCSTGVGTGDFAGTPTLNISFFHSENDSMVNGLITGGIVFDGTANLVDFNLSIPFVNRGNYSVCIFPNGTTQVADVLIEYVRGGKNFNYNFDNTIFTNVTRLLRLYVTDATSLVTFNVKDESADPVEGAIIRIQRYDVGTNTYFQTEILRTNADGDGFANLVLNTVFYRFIVEFDGVVKLTDGPSKITLTTKNFQISLLTDFFDTLQVIQGVNVISCVYNNDTFNFRFEYSDPSSEITHGCLKVTNRTSLRDIVVDDVCTLGSSGTTLINIGNPSNYSATFLGSCYVKFPDETTFQVGTVSKSFGDTLTKRFGVNGLFFGIAIIITLAMAVIYNAQAVILVSMVAMWLVHLFGLFGMSTTWLVAITILGGIALVLSGRK